MMQQQTKRGYTIKDENQRKIEKSGIVPKDHTFYNPKDTLWNEQSRLSPQLAKYCFNNVDPKTTFKSKVTDLQKIIKQEKEQQEIQKFVSLMKNKVGVHERYQKRKMERLVN